MRHKLGADGGLSDERAEPLAADLRDGGDGKRMALLKLVAGMLGIGLDTIVRREAQRRQKRLTLIAAASLTGMVVTSSLAVVAVRSRDEARNQRAAAEGLVGFMLGDLRAKLEPLGRLDTLDAVGARALKYYEGQSKSELSEEGLRQRARALTLIGEIANLRGDLDGALRRYAEARASTAEALRRAPDDEQRIFDHAQNVFWVGYIAWQRGKTAEAEADFGEYKRLSERLVALNPGKPEWRLERIYADSNLGTLQLGERRHDAAARTFAAALSNSEALAAMRPRDTTYQSQLAEILANLADAEYGRGRLENAIGNRESQLRIVAQMTASDGDNAFAKRQRMTAELMLGRMLIDHGDVDAGISHLRTATALAEELRQREPDNTEWLARVADTHSAMSAALLEAGRRGEADREIRVSCEIAHRLVERNPSVVSWRLDSLYICLTLRARSAAEQGSGREALRLSNQAIGLFLAPDLRRTGADRNYSSSEAALIAGDQYAASGDAPAARRLWTAALDTPVPPKPVIRLALSQRLGRGREAASLVARLNSTGWRSPAYLEERRLIMNVKSSKEEE